MNARDFLYAPCYCEENVWHLSVSPEIEGRPRFAVFISNIGRTCALWHQRASSNPLAPVIWDYHVILVVERIEGDGFEVFDLDSAAGFPLPAASYLDATFPFGSQIPTDLQPRFRIIEANDFRRAFASDRSHMHAPKDQTSQTRWIHPPPPWPLIQAPGKTMSLDAFVDMESDFVGQVTDLAGIRRRFAARS